MYLKGAIEKTGTGTEDMVKQCRSWGLADPEFRDGPDFRIVIRRRATELPADGDSSSKRKAGVDTRQQQTRTAIDDKG